MHVRTIENTASLEYLLVPSEVTGTVQEWSAGF